MISKAILVGATFSLIKGIFHLRRERLLNTIFKDVEKMQLYDLDYLQSLNDLPKNQYILLVAKAYKIDGVNYSKTLSQPPQEVLLKSYTINQPKQVVKDKIIERIWKTSHVNQINFELRGGINNDLSILVQPPNRPQIYLHELQGLRSDIYENEIKQQENVVKVGTVEKISNRNIQFTEYVVLPGKHYLFCAQLRLEGNQAMINPMMIFGDTKESFLDSLDQELTQTSTKAKTYFGACIGILTSYFLLVRYLNHLQQQKKKNQAIKQQDENI